MPEADDVYLGDAVYATRQAGMIRLTANPGSPSEHVIWLEPGVYAALVQYARGIGWEDPEVSP